MSATAPESLLAAALKDRRLLEHPFYLRWERGEVSNADLASYAAQYRHFEAYLPEFLGELVEALPEGTARDLVEMNLADELGDPISHVELFESFADAVGAGAEDLSPAMSDLLGMYAGLLASGPEAALAGFVAYEAQSSDIATRKAEGLREHYGLEDNAVSFWEHHASVDARHGVWASQALEACAGDSTILLPFARQAAEGWWGFLDEREELALAGGVSTTS